MSWQDPLAVLLLTYWTVLAAELIGDKSIYTVTSLAMRFRPGVVYCGISAAFMVKMLVAILFGGVLSRLPVAWASAISTLTFLISAICIWFKKQEPDRPVPEAARTWQSAAAVSFLAIFCSEWADFGQLSAAALVAKYHAPSTIWLGGSLALCTKGALAMTLGMNLRQRVPDLLARTLATASCLVLALVSLRDLVMRN